MGGSSVGRCLTTICACALAGSGAPGARENCSANELTKLSQRERAFSNHESRSAYQAKWAKALLASAMRWVFTLVSIALPSPRAAS